KRGHTIKTQRPPGRANLLPQPNRAPEWGESGMATSEEIQNSNNRRRRKVGKLNPALSAVTVGVLVTLAYQASFGARVARADYGLSGGEIAGIAGGAVVVGLGAAYFSGAFGGSGGGGGDANGGAGDKDKDKKNNGTQQLRALPSGDGVTALRITP